MKSRKVMLRLFLILAIAATSLVAFQSGTQRFAHIVAKKITVNGASGLVFAVGNLDLNGIAQLILDGDGDTSLTADTDDQIDVEVGGADEYIFTAGVFDIGNGTVGRIDLDADNDTSIRSKIDDTIDLEIGGTDEYSFTASVFDIGNGTAKRIDMDADNDTSIRSSSDDIIAIEMGGQNHYILQSGIIDIANAAITRVDMDIDNDTSVRSPSDDVISLEIGGTDEITATAAMLSINNTFIRQDINTENIGLPTVLTKIITYTAAAGGSGTVATIGDGEIWLVHSVFISVTTNFDATGDDATLTIGDGNDADGFIVAADANLQITFTEATGYAAGLYGIEAGSGGAYTLDDGGPFYYAPVGAAETIDWLIDETSGETLTAGQATIYVVYTRIQ